jgi:hypothetical protein
MNKIMAKVDMSALEEAAAAVKAKEDADFTALIQEKQDAGRLAKVGPNINCHPRPPTRFEPSFLVWDGIV